MTIEGNKLFNTLLEWEDQRQLPLGYAANTVIKSTYEQYFSLLKNQSPGENMKELDKLFRRRVRNFKGNQTNKITKLISKHYASEKARRNEMSYYEGCGQNEKFEFEQILREIDKLLDEPLSPKLPSKRAVGLTSSNAVGEADRVSGKSPRTTDGLDEYKTIASKRAKNI